MQEYEAEPHEIEKAETLHMEAENAREKGDFAKALELTDAATVKYQKEGNVIKLAEVQSSRFLTFRHLFEATNDVSYKILASHAVESSVDIMRQIGMKNGLGIPLYNLAKWYQTNEEYDKSVATMKESLEAFDEAPEDPQARPSVKAEIKTRLSSIEYGLGDDDAMKRFNVALEDLESSDEDSYNKAVWLSGAHMHIAEAFLRRDDATSAQTAVDKALSIVNSDDRLTLRKEQIQKLQERIQ